MKSVVIFYLLFFGLIQKCDREVKSREFLCEQFVQTLFNSELFYIPEPGQINITGIDTITILDRHGYLHSMNCSTKGQIKVDDFLIKKGSSYSWSALDTSIVGIADKTYQILTDDEIPTRIISFKANLLDHENIKYRCYFILEEISMKNDSMYIHMDKLISNHRIGLIFIKGKDGWKLVDKLIGQF